MGDGHSPALSAKLAIRAQANQVSTLAFILSLIGTCLFFVLLHTSRQWSHGWKGTSSGSPLTLFMKSISRNIRRMGLRRFPGVPSLGHAAVVIIYFVLVLVGLFANLDNRNMKLIANVSSRSGWMAIANLLFVVFLALKNTPLAFLTAWSYERLNCLHRVAGYTAVALIIIHASCYGKYFFDEGKSSDFSRTSDVWGIVAAACWFLAALTAVMMRRLRYELFYYIHVSLWIVSLVGIALHQPSFAKKVVIGTIVAGSMWALDRVVRLVRLTVNSVNNSAKLTPLPNGGTRVTLAKPVSSAASGKHCFLWIPGVRMFETHPFTIASANPLEFVVAPHDGFTGDLHRYALANPGVSLKASVEGPYGAIPDPSVFETIVLVAGGSGASFTFGLAERLLRQMTTGNTKRIVFVWAVKRKSYFHWFGRQLKALTFDSRFSLQLYVTKSTELTMSSTEVQALSSDDHKKGDSSAVSVLAKTAEHLISDSSIDLEKAPPSPSSSDSDSNPHDVKDEAASSFDGVHTHRHRPDISKLIGDIVTESDPSERVLIAACGPETLMNLVRGTSVNHIRADGPSIELHCELFGW